ncbi:MAG: DUF6488 family protein [Candidatus Marithrix sp.]
MNTLATTLVLSSLLFGTPVIAGTGHDHAPAPINQQVAEKKADEVIASFVEREKIDKSWSSIKASSVEKKVINGNPEWVVIFNNEKITDIDKQQLYVSLTIAGEYIAVNYIPADAGHGHSHAQAPVNQQVAEKKADEIIASLVERKKVDKSWASIKASSVEKKMLNGHSEWVVIFNNEKITDIDKQKLYVFLTIGGEYIAVNYTGK